MIETEQTWHTETHMTKVITHKGFRRIVKILPTNEIIKDETTLFWNHPKNCNGCEE